MSFLTRAASGGVVGGASSLSTAGSIAYVASAGVLGQDPTFARSNPGRYTLYDNTPTTGVTTFNVRAGAGQGAAVIQAWQDAAGSTLAWVSALGGIAAASFVNSANLIGIGGGQIGIASSASIVFSSTNAWSGSPDLGFVRDAAGRLRVSNGSTGLGSIMIASSTPASASATGAAGTIAWDANYIYVCTATNTWKRVAIATW